MTATATPPTPRRCRRILEAHHLDCQGLSPEEIATKLRCARSTVYAYFRDFQLHRAHILRTVAATRELRLLLQSLPAIEAPEHTQREQSHSETEMFPDGHRRLINGPNAGQCATHCSGCFREHFSRPAGDSDEPGITQPEPDQSSPDPDQPAPIQTNLDKSGQENDENPVPDNRSVPTRQNSPPILRQPQNWPRLTTPQRPDRSVVIPLPDLSKY